MTELVTNADDVEVVISNEEYTPDGEGTVRFLKANEYTLTSEQNIASVGAVGQVAPKGLSKGDLEYSFDFTIQGEDLEAMDIVSDDIGDSLPFDYTVRKPQEGSTVPEWEYSLKLCLADTEEISGTTSETNEIAVEGMAAALDKEIN